MHLSKQEFSKLSKADRIKIMQSKNNKKIKSAPKRAVKGSSLSRSNFGNQRIETMPLAYTKKVTQMNPVERSRPNGIRCIKFKEYVQDIAGSVGFATTQFQCNPGLSNLFAWLSLQAIFYQEYTVKRLRFTFETEKGATLSGKVMYVFLQDSADAAPASKQEMLENLLKASGAIYQPFHLDISMANFPALGHSRFIRSGNLAANLDVKTYDIGQLVVGTQGMADTTLAGELYIEYDLELRTPLQSAAQLATALSVNVANAASTVGNIFGTAPAGSLTGAGTTYAGGLNVTAALNVITFNSVGQYEVVIRTSGTVMNTILTPVTAASTAAVVVSTGFSNASANAGTSGYNLYFVTVTARGQTLSADFTTQATTITNVNARVGLYATSNA